MQALVSEVTQSCLTLCDPMDSSPPGSGFMGFSRQEYWSGLSFPSPGDLPNPGIEPRSPALQADALTSEPPGTRPYLTGASQVALTSLVAQTVKRLPTMWETQVQYQVLPSPGDLPDPGIEPGFPALEADALTSEPPGKPIIMFIFMFIYRKVIIH